LALFFFHSFISAFFLIYLAQIFVQISIHLIHNFVAQIGHAVPGAATGQSVYVDLCGIFTVLLIFQILLDLVQLQLRGHSEHLDKALLLDGLLWLNALELKIVYVLK
jgi:hypothetical protein